MMKKYGQKFITHPRTLSSLFKREDTFRFRRAYLRLSGQVSRFYRDERRSRIVNEHAGRESGARERKVSASAGFTVIELIIALGLFITLFGIVSASFVNAMRTERRIVSLAAANDSANTSIEQMAREIRTGSNFDLRFDLRNEGDLSFTNYKGEDVTYTLVANGIERGVSDVFKKITADNVRVNTMKFFLCDPIDCPTPRVSIVMSVGSSDPGLEAISLDMQTTVSARF